MHIHISPQAIEWFQEEMDAQTGDWIQFFARYGGSSPLHEGFSLGIRKEQPDHPAVQTTIKGIHFYIEQRDEWFFQQHDLHVSFEPKQQELTFAYK